MKQFRARVRSNRNIAKDYYEMVFDWPESAESPLPGQFISVKSFGTADLILRRPFAISAFETADGFAAIIYQKRGKATSMLAATDPGELVDLVGPLGNSFPLTQELTSLLVGGGVGLGPIVFLGSRLASLRLRPTVVLGFRDASCVPTDYVGALRFEPVVCTDDGSVGFHGTTVDWLRAHAAEGRDPFARTSVYACGPNAMMSVCSDFCERLGLPCWVSMEQIMGCGVGACVGCAIPVNGSERFARVCTEGPVFESRAIQWEQIQ